VLHQPLRMIDANLNRSGEGLRVLEDVARFILNNAELCQRLRTLRHDLAQETKALRVGLLSQRDAENDVGRLNHIPPGEKKLNVKTTSLQGLLDSVTANAKRVEESLRVIEELAKLPDINSKLNPAKFEQARFTLYTLERDLISRISRRDKIESISGLYVILDRQFLNGRDELDVTRQIIEGGARIIQYRDKQSKKGELLLVAHRLREFCSQAGILFIINDHLDVAMAVGADGLHVGQEDLPLPVIRRELPIDRIIGCSVTTLSQAVKAQTEGADYIAIGSIFHTTTKREATVVGLDTPKEIKRTVSIPVVAIGGINHNNVDEVVAAGADAIAVVSAVLGEKDVKGAVQKLVAKIDLGKERCQSQ
jgi:thiamine-phosphate pyrophosphorylase